VPASTPSSCPSGGRRLINETVGKTSAGAVEYMPLVQIGNIAQTLKQLKKRGFWVIGADMDGETDYFHSSLTDPVVLVIGSEGRGISHLVKETCDVLVQIPHVRPRQFPQRLRRSGPAHV
jgi:23S rRNA (guanosine2251-2'-O)-methyltransferase